MNSRTLQRISAETAKWIFRAASIFSVLALLLITVFLIAYGAPAIFEIGPKEFLLGTQWQPNAKIFGILPMILASIYITLGAALIGFPLGLLTAVFLAEVAPPRLANLVRPLIKLLAGIPSVVCGFFGLMVLVPRIMDIQGAGNSMLAAMIILGIMILPTVVSISETALRAVPSSYKEASYALGESRISTIFRVTIPAAKSGILTSFALGAGRAIGEATAVALVAGNKVQIPSSIFDSVRTLTTNCVFEMGYASGLHQRALFATAVILFILIILINIALSVLGNKEEKHE
ncbi:MAG TPA: phosphate ABC transporter permease subunit PstC [Firmicutes bacterium]|nr:phosphate ABC transporter permease subunit PstC [Bacillota bacterium]